jgi:hypothetical protein
MPAVRLRPALRWAFAVAVLTSLPSSGASQSPDVSAVMTAARDALGGAKRIEGVRTVIATGRTRQIRGDNLIPIVFEIQIELPDKYSRRDEFPAQDAGPATAGFNGDGLVQIPPAAPPVARAGGPPPPTPAQQTAAGRARVGAIKQDFGRLMLGLFASSFSSFPLTFEYVAQAEAPEGKADVIDVKGPDSFAARLFVDAQTHLPIMVTWRTAQPPARGGGPSGRRGGPPVGGAGAGPAAPGAAAIPAVPPVGAPALVENRMYFADYRVVDGLKLPFRIRRAVGAETTEETTFDRFRINARVDPKRFEVGN